MKVSVLRLSEGMKSNKNTESIRAIYRLLGLTTPSFSFGGHFSIAIYRVSESNKSLLSGLLNNLEVTDLQIDKAASNLFGLLSGPLNEVLNSNDIDVVRLLLKNAYNTAQLAEQLQKPSTTVKNM